jgi:hypothetical protein
METKNPVLLAVDRDWQFVVFVEILRRLLSVRRLHDDVKAPIFAMMDGFGTGIDAKHFTAVIAEFPHGVKYRVS